MFFQNYEGNCHSANSVGILCSMFTVDLCSSLVLCKYDIVCTKDCFSFATETCFPIVMLLSLNKVRYVISIISLC